jgi:hypothetical protein
MKSSISIFLLVFVKILIAQQTLSWSSYTVQTTSGTVSNGCINMNWTITTTGSPNWANSTPKYINSIADGTGLKLNVNWVNQTSSVVLTLDFLEGTTTVATPVSFSIYNVNATSSGAISKFIDSIRVTGKTLSNAVVNPNSITSDSDNLVSNPSIKGSQNGVDNPETTTNISFTTAVKQITITYTSGKKFIGGANSTSFDPTSQFITIGTINTNYVCTLPVSFSNFSANCVQDYVKLKWTTESEIKNDYFEVERSENGLDFNSITRIDGNGTINVQQNYQYIDEQSLFGTSYYRLKQVDFDGKVEYFNPIFLDCKKTNNFSIYPNPNNGSFVVSGLSEDEDMQLTDALGRTLLSKKGEINYEINSLQEGIYFITIKNKFGLVQSQKIVVHR